MLFELILAANYLDIKSLLDLTCAKVASMIKGKNTEEIRSSAQAERSQPWAPHLAPIGLGCPKIVVPTKWAETSVHLQFQRALSEKTSQMSGWHRFEIPG